MAKKRFTAADFTRERFQEFLTKHLSDTYKTAGLETERILEEKRQGSSPNGFLEYLKAEEQELLKVVENRMLLLTNEGVAFVLAQEKDAPETNWQAEYLAAIGGKGPEWFAEYVAKIWREVRRDKIRKFLNRLTMDKAEFQRRLAEQLKFKMKTAERLVRKEIEGRCRRMDLPSFKIWLKEEREKLLSAPELVTNDHGPFYSTENPEENAQIFTRFIEFAASPIPVDWWEAWEFSMPFLSNIESRQNQDWKYKGNLLLMTNAVNADVRAKVFTEYIVACEKPMKKGQPDFETIFTDKTEALALGREIGAINEVGKLRSKSQKMLAAYVWLLIEKGLIELNGISQSLALQIIAHGLGSTSRHKNTWNNFQPAVLQKEAERLLRESRE